MSRPEISLGARILLIDDDVELCGLLTEYLQGEGFEVDSVYDGVKGLKRALSGDYAAVVLDIMLPGMQGLEVLKRLRLEASTPVLMLTARGDEVDRIVGLEVGADDYVPKPFNPRELLARLRAVLRRTQSVETALASHTVLRHGDLTVDPGRRTVMQDDQEVTLTAAEFDLLTYFLQHTGQVVSREQIAVDVLGRGYYAHDRSIDMHVSKLRRKLGPHADGNDRLKSVRSVGYLYTFPGDESRT